MKLLEAGNYKIQNEQMNEVAKIWWHFKPITHPVDLLHIQTRVSNKRQQNRPKAKCGMLTSNNLYNEKGEKQIGKVILQLKNECFKSEKSRIKNSLNQQKERNKNYKRLLKIEKAKLPVKLRRGSILHTVEMIELQKQIQEYEMNSKTDEINVGSYFKNFTLEDSVLKNAISLHKYEWAAMLDEFDEVCHNFLFNLIYLLFVYSLIFQDFNYNTNDNQMLVLFQNELISLQQLAMMIHFFFEEIKTEFSDREKFCKLILYKAVTHIILELLEFKWRLNQKDVIQVLKIQHQHNLISQKISKKNSRMTAKRDEYQEYIEEYTALNLEENISDEDLSDTDTED